MKKRIFGFEFDSKFLLFAFVANVVAVFWINFFEGGAKEAGVSSIVQACVSLGLAGFTGPYTKKKAKLFGYDSYFYGAVCMASFVTTVGGLLHWIACTPGLWWTIAWNFGMNFFSGALLIYAKRNVKKFWSPIQTIINWL